MIPVGQSRYLHGPRRLEIKRSRSPLAPPEIELPESLFTALLHETPVHEIVGSVFVVFRQRPCIVWQYLVLKVKAEDSRDRRLPLTNTKQPHLFRKFDAQLREQIPRENRCSQPVHTLGIDLIEFIGVEIFGPLESRLP